MVSMGVCMRNHIRRALLLLASTALAATVSLTSTSVTTYAADDDIDWDDDGDIDDEPEEDVYWGDITAPSDIRITKGTSVGVDAGVLTNAPGWSVKWSVSGSAASISGSSKDTANIYGSSSGTSTITVTLYDRNGNSLDSDYFHVYVSDPEPQDIKVTGISINCGSMTITVGDTARLRATVYPLNATNKDVSWSTSNSDIVKVDGDGVIRAKRTGDAVIYARAVSSGDVATCKVHVSSADKNVCVTGIAVDSHNVSLKAGTSRNVNPRVTPSNARNKGYTASTSNANVAIVDGNGNIIGINNGTCVITYRTNEHNIKSTVNVTVYGGSSSSTQQVTQQQVAKAVQSSQQQAATAAGHDPNVQYGYLQQIAAAPAGSTVLLHASAPSAYDQNVINGINSRPDIKVIAEFPFQGYEFHMYMPAGFNTTGLLTGGYVDWLTLCNYQGKGITVSQVGPAQP